MAAVAAVTGRRGGDRPDRAAAPATTAGTPASAALPAQVRGRVGSATAPATGSTRAAGSCQSRCGAGSPGRPTRCPTSSTSGQRSGRPGSTRFPAACLVTALAAHTRT